MTVGVIREAWLSPWPLAQESSLQATSMPPVQLPLRMYTTVSYPVAVPQVSMVAWPDAEGVHWYTFSAAPPLLPQDPVRVEVPPVAPLKVPPAAGMGVGFAQAAPPGALSVIGTVTVLLLSFSSGIRPKGSTVTRSV
jgi:hypothetical protein